MMEGWEGWEGEAVEKDVSKNDGPDFVGSDFDDSDLSNHRKIVLQAHSEAGLKLCLQK
jgi:hypothetical protein